MKIIVTVFLLFFMYGCYSEADYSQPKLVNYTLKTHPREYCLALNIYHEARNDNAAGKFAVADVVLNRASDPRWPSDICQVVQQTYTGRRHQCQFSWHCDGKDDTPLNYYAWKDAQYIAYEILHNGRLRGITEGATHYHATYVNPYWNKSYKRIGRIGEHVFYRS